MEPFELGERLRKMAQLIEDNRAYCDRLDSEHVRLTDKVEQLEAQVRRFELEQRDALNRIDNLESRRY